MTRSNRTLNRLLLALVGVTALALAALVAGASRAMPVPDGVRPLLEEVLRRLGAPANGPLLGAAGLVVAALAVAWIATRGRGGTATADSDADVDIAIDAVRDIAGPRLASARAIVGTRIDAHRLRGRTVLTITLSTRRRADLAEVVERARETIAELDRRLGVELPVVVRIRSGWRSAVAREQRAE